MSVPDFQSLFLPTLRALSDGKEMPVAEIRDRIAHSENLKPEDLSRKLPSGLSTIFVNRTSWALFHTMHAGLVEKVRRAVYRLTVDGQNLLAKNPTRIDLRILRAYPAYVERMKMTKTKKTVGKSRPIAPTNPEETPEETLDRVADELHKMLKDELLARVCNASPAFFEQVVIDLLIAMGYGGGDAKMGHVTGRSGDGGIDGTIQEDTLGLDEVYVQAKKYSNGHGVGANDLRNFAGAIDAAGTTKGVFVTTAAFTKAAKQYVERSPKRIVLIDGEKLASLMVQHNVGVRTRIHHEIKRLDENYFDPEDV